MSPQTRILEITEERDWQGAKLNIGCGNSRIEGYIGIDIKENDSVDLIHDISLSPLPIPSDVILEIVMFHSIEHIEKRLHVKVLEELHRVLQRGAGIYISYPEFSKIAENWLKNTRGLRPFWECTIYGLQRYPGDYHVSLMHTPDFVKTLQECGFTEIVYCPEPLENHNTVIYAIKGDKPQTYEDLLIASCFPKE